jgi:hypothetical protein
MHAPKGPRLRFFKVFGHASFMASSFVSCSFVLEEMTTYKLGANTGGGIEFFRQSGHVLAAPANSSTIRPVSEQLPPTPSWMPKRVFTI